MGTGDPGGLCVVLLGGICEKCGGGGVECCGDPFEGCKCSPFQIVINLLPGYIKPGRKVIYLYMLGLAYPFNVGR